MINVSAPDIGELEHKYVIEAVRSGWVSSIGPFINRFEESFAAFCEVPHGVAVTNGTDALVLALRVAGVGPGDEVIVPVLTFAAVAAAVRHVGAEVVLVDVHPEYWCLDPEAVDRAISNRTRAIIAVHSYGHPADMDPLLEIAQKAGVLMIEDCAEAHGARYKGKRVGSLGDLGCFSFYGNKIITTGEGGMVVAKDPNLAERVRFLKDHAMDPKRRYYHTDVGYNYRMTNLQAALGCAQMERISGLLAKRAQLLKWYRDRLADVSGVAVVNPVMPWAEPVNWMVSILLDDDLIGDRVSIEKNLRARGVDTRPFFVPIHRMPPYASCRTVSTAGSYGDELIADRIGSAGLNLPTIPSLTEDQVSHVVSALQECIEMIGSSV